MGFIYFCLFAALARVGDSLLVAPEKNYRKARWAGIILGALFAPVLTIPCFYAVWLMGRSQRS
jgi:hypothetical protein